MATLGFELASVTSAPPLGAAAVSLMVPVELAPPLTVDGLSVSVETVGSGAAVTVRVVVLLTPPYEPPMLTAVVDATVDVVTVNVFDVEPGATVTLAGTLAAPGFVLESVTTAPPAGAGAVSVTVPVEVAPPLTVLGFSVSVESVGGGGGGVTVKVAVFVTLL